MTRRRIPWLVVALVVFLAVVVAATLLDPAARVRGWVAGEPFYQGRAATAWRYDLNRSDEVAAAATRDVLAAGKGEAVPVCAWLLERAPEPGVRLRAADALKAMEKAATPAGPALVRALGDADPLVRGTAVRAVADLAPDVPGAVPALVKLFPDVEAIRAVSRFKGGAAEAVPPLTELLKSSTDPNVRRQAARTLGKIGEPALPAVPDLLKAMETDGEVRVVEQSAEALGDIGPAVATAYPAVLPALVKVLKHPNRMVRRDAVRSLGQIGPAAKPFLADVQALASDPEEVVRKAAADAARKIDPTQAK